MRLTKDNYEIYAAHGYDSVSCLTEEEFYTDLKKVSNVKLHLNRIGRDMEVNYRLLLNNVISLYNVFDRKVATNLVVFKLEDSQYDQFFTVLEYLNISTENDFVIDYVQDTDIRLRIEEVSR